MQARLSARRLAGANWQNQLLQAYLTRSHARKSAGLSATKLTSSDKTDQVDSSAINHSLSGRVDLVTLDRFDFARFAELTLLFQTKSTQRYTTKSTGPGKFDRVDCDEIDQLGQIRLRQTESTKSHAAKSTLRGTFDLVVCDKFDLQKQIRSGLQHKIDPTKSTRCQHKINPVPARNQPVACDKINPVACDKIELQKQFGRGTRTKSTAKNKFGTVTRTKSTSRTKSGRVTGAKLTRQKQNRPRSRNKIDFQGRNRPEGRVEIDRKKPVHGPENG
ncbi:hypothetical protein K504DRAFT_536372 [Pleomassaria siparia CBS 279.74]|uniref:Uncharacterized protein n=1 Tax=Pleomassaria siparia CBS 279.74 TaxID=1314801 RepID=A0A6G1JZS2_9PLEO|nr:hypothetical protein K504DRAFT_536372 [Pleomassaria siparia CBS 279.74]